MAEMKEEEENINSCSAKVRVLLTPTFPSTSSLIIQPVYSFVVFVIVRMPSILDLF